MDQQQPEKLLHREQVIRFAGLLFMIAPFANILTVIMASNQVNRWSFVFLLDLFKAGSWLQWLMQLASLVVGFMMLKGRRETWMPVLAVLFTFIVYGVFKYKEMAKTGWVLPALALAINISLFLLVYYQEYWQITYGHLKQKLKPAAGANIQNQSMRPSDMLRPIRDEKSSVGFPGTFAQIVPEAVVELKQHLPQAHIPPRFDLSLLIGLSIEFEGVGPWAYIEGATDNEIHLEIFANSPEGIDSRKVEIPISDAGILQFRLTSKAGSKAAFRLEKIILVDQMAG
jgi:hypothetical protein